MPDMIQIDNRTLRLTGSTKIVPNGGDSKTAKVSVLVRSSNPVDLPQLGLFNVLHDFSTMSIKAKVPLDYEHDKEIGWLNRYDVKDGNLVMSGAVIPFGDNQAGEIVHMATEGYEYQASLQSAPNYNLDLVEAGRSVVVNGVERSGPLVIVRDWTLDAVALCKLGVDTATSSQFFLSKKDGKFFLSQTKADGNISMNMNSDKVATVEDEANKAESEAAVEKVEEVAAEVEPEVEKAEAVDAVEADSEKAKEGEPVLVSQATIRSYADAFGYEQGMTYLLDGLSMEAALQKHVQHLLSKKDEQIAAQATELEAVKQELSQAKSGRGFGGTLKLSQTPPAAVEKLIKIKK